MVIEKQTLSTAASSAGRSVYPLSISLGYATDSAFPVPMDRTMAAMMR